MGRGKGEVFEDVRDCLGMSRLAAAPHFLVDYLVESRRKASPRNLGFPDRRDSSLDEISF